MIFAAANFNTEIHSAAVLPAPGTSAGLGSACGLAQSLTQGCAGYTGIARAEWDPLPGGAFYK